MGCPIRVPADQRLLTAPRGLSQPSAPFIGPRRQGIHRAPVVAQRPCSRTTPSRQDRLTSTTLLLSTYPRPHGPRPNHPPPPDDRCLARTPTRPTYFSPIKNGPPSGRTTLTRTRGYLLFNSTVGCWRIAVSPAPPKSGARSVYHIRRPVCRELPGGDGRIRTPDLPRARRALSH